MVAPLWTILDDKQQYWVKTVLIAYLAITNMVFILIWFHVYFKFLKGKIHLFNLKLRKLNQKFSSLFKNIFVKQSDKADNEKNQYYITPDKEIESLKKNFL